MTTTRTPRLRLRADELRNGDELSVAFRGGDLWGKVLWTERLSPGRTMVTVSILAERRIMDLDLAIHSRHDVRRPR